MTDREMLELAAKAARIHVFNWNEQLPKDIGQCRGAWIGTPNPAYWNPLTYDGDALKLAVQLGMLFTYMVDRFEMFQRFYREELDNDLRPSEATRRAIVRAAAEIGKEMP